MELSFVGVVWVDVDLVEMLGQVGQDAKMLEASHVLFFETLEFFL
jgi:hypothetical protein